MVPLSTFSVASRTTLRSSPLAAIALVLVAATALGSCNDYPVHSLLDTFEVRVTQKLSNKDAIKLDFLWVIDHSPSMCQEQRALAQGFETFVSALQNLGQIDVQMAVVTVQQTPDPGSSGTVQKVGAFMHKAATKFPPNCIERVNTPCQDATHCKGNSKGEGWTNFQFQTVTDSSLCPSTPDNTSDYTTASDQTGLDKSANWRCDDVSAANYIANLNCSVNTYCTSKCATDDECKKLYSDDSIECHVPGGTTKELAGCMYPPPTKGCPSNKDLPDIITQDNLELFRCISTVGASQTQESGFEGGFRSAWTALDRNGENCPKDKDGKPTDECQYKRLVREDAYLIIVFISDDDDCSVRLELDPKDQTKEKWVMCQRLGDAFGGNRELNEGYCEFKRTKDLNVYCPSDCMAGSTRVGNAPSGKEKACTKDNQCGDTERCCKKGETDCGANFFCHPLKCANGCKEGSAEREACHIKADEAMAKWARVDSAFAPVGEFVNRFKTLKDDPARVIVAAIVGDATKPDAKTGDETLTADQGQRDRVNYYHASFKNIAPGQIPTICKGARGEAGYGSRYVQFAEAFGENGMVENICKGESFAPALENVARTILKRVVKVCLPQPPQGGLDHIRVRRTRAGVTTELIFCDDPNDANDHCYYVKPSPDCRAGRGSAVGQAQECNGLSDCPAGLACIDDRCQVYTDAIFFTVLPEPGDEIEVSYEADLGL